jgi:putative tricarboxylic transport membrane protein
MKALSTSDQWKNILAQKGWADTFLAGDEFAAYLDKEVKDTTAILTSLGIAQ